MRINIPNDIIMPRVFYIGVYYDLLRTKSIYVIDKNLNVYYYRDWPHKDMKRSHIVMIFKGFNSRYLKRKNNEDKSK